MTVQTSPPLDELLLCQRIGRNLTHRACLRRQFDHQELHTQVGRKLAGREAKTETRIGPPCAPFCASGRCDLGNSIQAKHPGAARTCDRCGAAIVGGPCSRCAEREAAKAPPKVLPPPAPSTRIWDTSHVEPDFVPPRAVRPTQHPTKEGAAHGAGQSEVSGPVGDPLQPGDREVKLTAVTADGIPENERFHKYTPSGSITLSVDNPIAFAALKEQLGKSLYVDFTPAD